MTRKVISIVVLFMVIAWGARVVGAADSMSKALFAYGAINAYMTSTWIAKSRASSANTT